MPEKPYKKKHMTSFQLIIMGFAGVILLGTVLLMLPFSSAEKVITPFHEALFTATSAVCVTGLVVKDTGSYWSVFGQTVILVLIQIGGLGVVTVAAAVSLLSGKRISLMQRSTIQDAISAPKVGGIVRLTRFILKGTLLIETVGAMLLLPVFLSDYGLKGVWMAVFHSVSAFCNAGFDILGTASGSFPSLTEYSGNILINVVIMLLIITGGIGFLTWDDIYTNRLKFKRYRMQSKIILVTTACLIFLPAVFFFVCDLKNLPAGERLLAATFQSVTTRTAGFNTINISEMSEASKAVMILLMLIGGSPGSTAGGMKTTTFAVLILNAIATFRSQENAGAFGRRLEYHVIKNAAQTVISINGKARTTYSRVTSYKIFQIDDPEQSDVATVALKGDIPNKDELEGVFYYLDMKEFRAAIEKLKTEMFQVEDYTEGSVTGTYTATEDNEKLMLTIPYDQGWRIECNGKKVIADADRTFTVLTMNKGENRITMKYVSPGFREGAIISLLAILLFAIWQRAEQKRKER